MKKTTLIFCLFILYSPLVLSQNSGRGFSYQAVARNTDGVVKAKENIEIQFTLLPGAQAATAAWQETQVATTDEFGIFSLTIGKGIKSGGTAATFKEVNFAVPELWLKVELKDKGAWQEISKTQLLSVPYAEVAGNAQPAPTGSIMAFAGSKDKIPTGWMLCDGTQLKRVEQAALYAVIGTAWGAGDGSSTFHIPDLRGLFLRGVSYDQPKNWDDGRNNRTVINPGGNTSNEVGSFQGEEFRSHRHTGSTSSNGAHKHDLAHENLNTLVYVQAGGSVSVRKSGVESNLPTSENGNHIHGLNIDNSGGNETRPDNAYVNYIIKL